MTRPWSILFAVAALLVGCGDDNPSFGSGGSSQGGSSSQGGASQGGSTSQGGSGGTATGTGGGAACVDFGEPCSACEIEACEDRYCECYGNVDCGLYASCAIDCDPGDAECLQACNTAYPDGITDAVLLNDCAATSCSSECEQFELYELTPCQTCLYEECESAMNDCLAVPDCSALLFCLADCEGSVTCQNTCYATYPNGIEPATPVGTCSSQNCASACAGG
jgi:hypothetical protein